MNLQHIANMSLCCEVISSLYTVCKRHILRSYEITFSEYRNLQNRNQLGWNFTVRHRVTWYALQMFHALCQTGTKWRQKKSILQSFLSPKQHIVSPTSWRTISMKFGHKMWISVTMKTYGTEFWNFSERVIFSEKPHFWGFLGYTCGAHVAALVFRPTENLSIVPYSRRGRDACISSVFFRMTYRFWDIGMQDHT